MSNNNVKWDASDFAAKMVEIARKGTDTSIEAIRTEAADLYASVHVARRGEAITKFTMAAISGEVDMTVVSAICDILANYADFATKTAKSDKTDEAYKMAKMLMTAEAVIKGIYGDPDFSDVSAFSVIAAISDLSDNKDAMAQIAKNALLARKGILGPNGTKTKFSDKVANLLERGDLVIGDILHDKDGNALIVEGSDKFRILDEEGNPTETVFSNVSDAGGHFTQRSTNGWIHFFKGETVIGDLRRA
jgi:hypothetical protein